MSKVTAKRTVKIPPCRIEKDLIREIGELLEKEELCKGRMYYRLDTKMSDVQSSKVNDFVKADWESDINKIELGTTDYQLPRVGVNFDFRRPEYSKFSVSGENATWVNGITNRIENKIKKYKLKYYTIKTNWLVKLPLTSAILVVLVYPIFLWLNSIPTIKENLFILIWLMFAFGFWGIYYLIQWLFPYFDYGDTLQKSMRKWIWVILFGSGIVPTIILKLLGF